MSETQKTKIYYDGACPLCSAEIGFYQRCNGAERLSFVDVAEATADTGMDLSRDKALARFHIRQSDGTLLSGARAFIAIWETLPRWRWAARLARLPGVPSLLEGLYRLFLPIRPYLSALVRRFARQPSSQKRQ